MQNGIMMGHHISIINVNSTTGEAADLCEALKPDKTLAKMALIVSVLHQALASSFCSSMDTNTSIMYEGSAVLLYSM